MEIKHGYVYDLLRNWGMGDFGARTAEFFVDRPLRILFVVVLAVVFTRLGRRAVRRLVHGLTLRASRLSASPTAGRAGTRADTLAAAGASVVGIVVWTIALLSILRELGVDVAPLIAGAGIAGVAIGFGAQSLVRDILAGVFILAEDRFGVGDTIDAGEATGTVEDVNLRVTRLRGVDGTVWFIPNGEIKRVGNQSMEWHRAVVDMVIGFDNDLAAVLASVREEAAAMAAEDEWSSQVLEAPDVWGVQSMDGTGLTVRVVVKTVPAASAPVARAMRARLGRRLRAEGVRMPGAAALLAGGGSLGTGSGAGT